MWIGSAILWLAFSAGAQAGQRFKARLSPVPMDATMKGNVTGLGSVTAVLEGTKLTITGTFEGLRTSATVARLHNGPTGVRGPAFFDLSVSKETSGKVSGSLDLTPAQVEDLKKGRFYVQVHSEKAPEGNLWGWLLR